MGRVETWASRFPAAGPDLPGLRNRCIAVGIEWRLAMAAPSSPLRPYHPLIMLGGIVLATATLYWAQKILIPLALAALLAFVLNPVVVFVQRRGLPRVLSVTLIVCLSFLLLGGIG